MINDLSTDIIRLKNANSNLRTAEFLAHETIMQLVSGNQPRPLFTRLNTCRCCVPPSPFITLSIRLSLSLSLCASTHILSLSLHSHTLSLSPLTYSLSVSPHILSLSLCLHSHTLSLCLHSHTLSLSLSPLTYSLSHSPSLSLISNVFFSLLIPSLKYLTHLFFVFGLCLYFTPLIAQSFYRS